MKKDEKLTIAEKTTYVQSRVSVGTEGRVTCCVMRGDTLIAQFEGATARKRAEECLALAERQQKKGIPIVQTTKCVADGVSLKRICKDNELPVVRKKDRA